MKAWLETSVVISLHFRNAEVAEATRRTLPTDASPVVSRYVLFELARGYLSSLRVLHAETFACQMRHDLRVLVKSGNRRHTYKGPTWTDVLDDHLFLLEEDGDEEESAWQQMLPDMFRARLAHVIHRGWAGCVGAYGIENPAGCRDDLPAPYEDQEKRIQHALPLDQCGQPGNCGVLAFVRKNAETLERVRAADGKLKAQAKKGERERRLAGLGHLLAASDAEGFEGERCHHCGDAMIAMEATAAGGCAVTKDKEFPRLCKALGGAAPVMVKHTP